MKQLLKRGLVLLATVFCLFSATASPAFAADEGTVVRDAPVEIPQGQITDNVLVIGHPATIAGTVTDTVFVFHGDVHLTSTSDTGMVVAIGGVVKQEPGAKVRDTAISFDFNNTLLNSLFIALISLVGLWGLWLAFSILLIVAPYLIAVLVRDRLLQAVNLASGPVVRIGGIGFVLVVLVAVASLLLGLTVIGFPVAVVMLLALLAAAAYGYTVVSYRIGDFFLQDRFKREGTWFSTLVGAVLIISLSNVPLLGWILLFLVGIVSVGVAVVAIWSRRLAKKTKKEIVE